MRRDLKCFVLLCIATLFFSVSLSAAQDAAVTALGSGIARDLLLSLGQATGASVDFSVTGSSAGIDQFCNGEHDLVAASRPISAAEAAICASNEITQSEFLLAHRIVALAAHPGAPADCLRPFDLDSLLKPSASHLKADWMDYSDSEESLPLTLYLPADMTLEYAILDSMVVGDGLRRGVEVYEDTPSVLARVAATEGALALTAWLAELAADASMKLLNTGADCVAASAENVEADLYPAAQSLYLYANSERMNANESAAALVRHAIAPESAELFAGHGFAPPSEAMIAFNAQVLQDPAATAAASDGATDFVIPANLAGEVVIAGSANLYSLLDNAGRQLTRANPQLTVSVQAAGQDAGIARFCAGEAAIAMLNSDASMLSLAECEAQFFVIDLGVQATVLLGNGADAQAACLTTTQIDRIWNAASAGSVTDWSDVDASLPEQPLTLFGPVLLDRHADMLFADRSIKPPLRRDTEQDYDPLYRAAAVANVPGALTFMPWSDYLRVQDNHQANIQSVSVDAGAGCVDANLSNIGDGAYALAQAAQLLVSESALADIKAQSVLWQLLSDESFFAIENANLAGIERADLAARRRELETRFRLAEAATATEAADETDDSNGDSE